MPFTFSHPAIVLPLAYLPRQWVSLTGLVAGSLAPDFEYFIRMRLESNFSHTIKGMFLFDLPLALLIAFVYHTIVRNKLIENLPAVLKSRVSTFNSFDWNEFFKKKWPIAVISMLIGAASHIFWDDFTHHDGYFVKRLPILASQLYVWGMEVQVFRVLQYTSTLLGAIIIAFAVFNLPEEKNVTQTISVKYWSILILIAFVVVAIRLLSGLSISQYSHVIATVISAFLIGLILTPLLMKTRIFRNL